MFDKIIEFVVRFAKLFQFFTIVPQYQGSIILRLGKFHRSAATGFNWLIPAYIEKELSASIITETMLVGPQSLQTKDGKEIIISTVVTFRVDDPRTFLLEIEGTTRVIEDTAFGEVAAWVTEQTFEELVAADINAKLTSKLRRRARAYGVEIIRVQIVDLTKSRSIRLMQSVSTSYAPGKEF